MPTAIKFAINQVHDRVDRQRVARRCSELAGQYVADLGGHLVLSDPERTNIAIAAELVALVELGRERVRTSPEPGDPAALKRLEVCANQVLAKLQLDELEAVAA
jgi:hypothetical protein